MKKISIISFALAAAMSLTGCSDLLEAENKSAGAGDKELLTSDMLKTTCYQLMQSIAANIPINEEGTDLYVYGRSGTPTDLMTYNSLSAGNSECLSLYQNCYKIINKCNQLLSDDFGFTTNLTDAKFLRAYCYFKLTQQFGAVPYITRYMNDAERNYPRTDLKTCYENIIAELEGIQNDNVAEITYDGTVNKQAIRALLAKVYLAAGWDLGTTVTDYENGTYTVTDRTYFEKAAQLASSIADATPLTYSFEDRYAQRHDYDNVENFFTVQYLRDDYLTHDGTANGLQGQYGSYYGNAATSGCKQVSSKHVHSQKALYLWRADDQRYDGTFMTTIYRPGLNNGAVSTDWPNNGYYSYYTTPSSTGIQWMYGNANMTSEDFEAKIASLKDKLTFPAAYSTAKMELTYAFHMKDPVVKYYFNTDGSVNKTEDKAYVASLPSEMYFNPPVKKFDDIESSVSESGSFRPVALLTASDIYLAAAEAYAALDETSNALKYINKLRNRAGLGNLTSLSDYVDNEIFYSIPFTFGTYTLLDLVLDERAREMYAERTRWEDLRRTKQLVRYNVAYNKDVDNADQMKGVDGQFKILRPIPSNVISNNNGISNADQNPGYTAGNEDGEVIE